MGELAEGCLEGRAGRQRGRQKEGEGSGGRRGECRVRCDIVNATVN